MKTLVRTILLNSFALALLPLLYAGVTINGGITTILVAGFVLGVLSFFLKPILGIITFPINMVTFGIFSLIANSLILYVLTVIMPEIHIKEFLFQGTSFAGFVIPKVYVNTFFAYIVSFSTYSFIVSLINWLFRK